MASIINASSTGSGGIVQTADASGVLQLQSNGTVALTVSGSAVTFAGSSSASSISLNGASIGDYSLYAAMVARVGNGSGIGINSANSTDNAYIYFGYGTSSPNQQGAAIGRIGGDVLCLFTASTERMRISSAGYVTNPYQVAVAAYNTVGQSVASGAGTVITLGGTRFNIGSAFNTSTNTFTAPVAGYYMCTGIVSWTGTFSATRQFAMIYKNGAQTDGFGTQNARPSATDLGVATSGILYLAAGDTVQLAGFQESGSNQTILGSNNQTWTNLTIRLLG